ncbi:MAG: threonine ammonia-lyase [Limisphaerales bacterium]
MKPAIAIADIHEAAGRIAPHVVRTPCMPSESLSKELGLQLHFKAENLQHIGAFKARGATNAVFSLSEADATKGVVTHSSGNHAAALSRAASLRGIPAHVVMPHNSAPNKLATVRSFGVEPILCEPDADSRANTCAELQEKTGATFIHPYDNPFVMAGQGTVGLEILEQVPDVEVILVPVGGGGLLSGLLTAIKALRPQVQVIAAEPAWADDAARSLKSRQIEMPSRYDTIADGLRTPLGELTFPIIRTLLNDIILVSEDDIRKATRTIAEQVHLVAEPSGAVTFAAVRKAAYRFAGKSVVAVISGGNLDFGSCALGDS